MSSSPSETTLADRQVHEESQNISSDLRSSANHLPEPVGNPEQNSPQLGPRDEEKLHGTELKGHTDAEKDFEVKWEGGDDDPMNPRSMSEVRKWMVVLIVSASSLCV